MSTATALVVGGTGPTGPHIVAGLEERGYRVTVLHRGSHEIEELNHLEHLHADPHFRDSIVETIGHRKFDLVVATYGRLRHVASALAGVCERFIGVSGAPVYDGYHEPESRWPRGITVGASESDADARPVHENESAAGRFSRRIFETEQAVMELHDARAFEASLFRYPSIYGPRQVYPREWSIVRRVLDGRASVILPDDGLTITTRCSARNAAQFLLAAVDSTKSLGQIFNVADVQQFSLRQWTQLVSRFAGRELDVVSLPFELAGPGRDLFPVPHNDHGLLSIHKARTVLGYEEAVSAQDALAETVEWYLRHRPDARTVAGMIDTFDYAEEDRVVAEYRRATAVLLAGQSTAKSADHPYAHPTAPGAMDHRGR